MKKLSDYSLKKTKSYAITTISGSVILNASTKKEATEKFKERGYNITINDVYSYKS